MPKDNIIKFVAKKNVEEVDEWSLIKKLLEEQTKALSQQKVLSLAPEIVKQIKGDLGDKGIQGVQGEKGFTGEKGERGEKGEKGITGLRGVIGLQGKQGLIGDEGNPGKDAENGKPPKHEYKNGQIRFENPDNTWGVWIDLTKLMDNTAKKFGGGGKTLHRGFGPQFSDDETPSGTVNGVNDTFTTASTPINGSLKVYVNGSRMRVTEDYTLSGTTITFLTAPPSSSIILVDYRI